MPQDQPPAYVIAPNGHHLSNNRKPLVYWLAILLLPLALVVGIVIGVSLQTNTVINNPPPQAVIPNRELPALNQRNANDCVADECLSVSGFQYPLSRLDSQAQSAILKAIAYQHRMIAINTAAIGQFDNIGPFKMVLRSKEMGLAEIKAILDKYNLPIQENVWLVSAAIPQSVSEACSFGFNLETEYLSEMESQPALIKNHPDVHFVISGLIRASRELHLPSYQRCQ